MTRAAKSVFVRIAGMNIIPYAFTVASTYTMITLSKPMILMETVSVFVPTAAMRIMWNVRTAVNFLMKAS